MVCRFVFKLFVKFHYLACACLIFDFPHNFHFCSPSPFLSLEQTPLISQHLFGTGVAQTKCLVLCTLFSTHTFTLTRDDISLCDKSKLKLSFCRENIPSEQQLGSIRVTFWSQVCWWAMSTLNAAFYELVSSKPFGGFVGSRILALWCVTAWAVQCTSLEPHTAPSPGLCPPFPSSPLQPP